MNKELIESLGFVFQSQEIDGRKVIDYYFYDDDYKLEIEQDIRDNTISASLYSYGRYGIEVKFDGILRDIEDLYTIKTLCIL